MKRNMGNVDRILRIVLAIAMSILFFTNSISGLVGIFLLAVSGVFVLTSLVSFCPLYTLIGVNTCQSKKD